MPVLVPPLTARTRAALHRPIAELDSGLLSSVVPRHAVTDAICYQHFTSTGQQIVNDT